MARNLLADSLRPSMYLRTSRYFPALLCAATLALAACGTDGPTTPAVGQVRVTVSTTGPDMDPDGYTLTLDDTATAVVQSNGVATFPSVRAGQHSVAMSGMWSCFFSC